MLRALLIASVVLGPGVALAQSSPTAETPSARCLLAGKSFSPGATIRASSSVNICGPDGNWATTDQAASGCFFADNFYAVGASAAIVGNKSTVEVCGTDGTWTSKPAP